MASFIICTQDTTKAQNGTQMGGKVLINLDQADDIVETPDGKALVLYRDGRTRWLEETISEVWLRVPANG